MAQKKQQTQAKRAPRAQASRQTTRGRTQRKKTAKSTAVANLYNPFCAGSVPTSVYEGEALAITTKFTGTFTTSSTNRYVFCIGNTGESASILGRLSNAPGSSLYNGGFHTSDVTSGGPSSGRAMKVGIRITNTSKMLDRGGRIYTLVSNQRQHLPADVALLTAAQVNDLADSITAHPDTRAWDGGKMNGNVFHAAPHDQADYLAYRPWRGVDATENYFRHFVTTSNPLLTPPNMPMSAIWIVMEPNSVDNQYQLEVKADYYARFPADQVLSTLHRPVPTASPSVVNRMRSIAEDVGEAGGIATAMGLAKQYAPQLLRSVGALPLEEAALAAPLLL